MKLDKKDLKILAELDLNARQTNSQIAKKVGLSKFSVGYRIDNLIKNGIVENFFAVVDMAKLGYTFYRILIRFQDLDNKKEKQLNDYLKKHPSVAWIVRIEGDIDMAILFWGKNVTEFEEFYDDLLYRYNKYFENLEINIATAIYHFNHKFLFNKKEEVVSGQKLDNYKLDKIDTKILSIISNNARIPLVDIADKLNQSPKVIAYRIKKLIKNKIILAFRAKIDTSLLDYQHFKVFLILKKLTRERFKKLINYLSNHKNVIYITKAIGETNLEFEVEIKSNSELHECLNEMRTHFSDVIRNYKTQLDIAEIKINHFSG